MRTLTFIFVSFFIFSQVLNGCSKPKNLFNEYSRSQINSARETILATIVFKRLVSIEGDRGVGQTAGGLTGYITGSSLGNTDTENAFGAIARAIFGAT